MNQSSLQRLIAISNTGPFISAFQCGRTDLLERYFSIIYITPSIVTELEDHGWSEDIQALMASHVAVITSEPTDEERKLAGEIARNIEAARVLSGKNWQDHLVEAEAIVLMKHRDELLADVLFLDEKAARQIAQDMQCAVIGFPGLVGRAGLDGFLTKDDILELLKSCQQQGTHYSDTLIETVAQTYGR